MQHENIAALWLKTLTIPELAFIVGALIRLSHISLLQGSTKPLISTINQYH
jgi:hypothetical protein